MVPLSVLERVVWYAGIIATAVLLGKLVLSRLYHVYQVFAWFLVFRLVRSLVLLPFDPNSTRYAWIWVVSELVLLVFYVLVVLELYTLVLKDFAGIASLGRWVMTGALAVAVCVAALTLSPDLAPRDDPYPILTYVHVARRGVYSSLILFLGAILAFLRWYPVPMRRNLLLHAGVFSLYFLSSTLAVFIRNITGYSITRPASLAVSFVNFLALLTWLAFLNRAGEARSLSLRRPLPEGTEDRVLTQLGSLNATLLRSSRKR